MGITVLISGWLDFISEWRPTLLEWLQLLTRWTHVFAGIMWIGQTYFFTWMDARLSEEGRAVKEGDRPQLWMVHSGGFYIVEKQKGMELLPRTLHWFRWEAALTWLSGFVLLVLIYYLGGGLLDPDVSKSFVDWYNGLFGGSLSRFFNLSAHYTAFAITLGIALLIVAWLVYDLLAQSPLGRNEIAFAAICYILIVGITYGLTRVFSGRAAYIHVGAMFGTIMAANVWVRILPSQKKMIAAAKEGRPLDARLAENAKLRSKQNTFMVVPAVFIMISNHFPVSTYGNEYNWLVLAVLILAGWGAAKFIRRA